MLIRPMEITDLERVVALEEELFTSAWSESDFLYEILHNDFSFNYVLEDNGYIVGYIGVWIMYEQSQITTIGVDPKYQRQGLGKSMMNTVIDIVSQQGCETISLEVRISNQKAIALYENLGFQTVSIRKDYYQDNHEDAYLMLKKLEGRK